MVEEQVLGIGPVVAHYYARLNTARLFVSINPTRLLNPPVAHRSIHTQAPTHSSDIPPLLASN
jgi:hypothetical protein